MRSFNVKRVGIFVQGTEALDAYYHDIRKYKVMSKEEEIEWFNQYKTGDEKVREKAKIAIVNANLRFVVSVAKKYVRRDSDLLDYINEGNIGLIQALDNFDLSKNVKFITFAIHYIRKYIQDYQMGQPMVTQTNIHKTVYNLYKIKNDFIQKEYREPTTEEIIEILDKEYNIQIINESDILNLSIESIDNNLDDNENYNDSKINSEFEEKYYYENDVEDKINDEHNKTIIYNLMQILGETEQMIIQLHYGIDIDKEYTIYEISEITGYTPENIRQIIKNSEELMRTYAEYREEKEKLA
jgi:RNA polymerase primary sigma factor